MTYIWINPVTAKMYRPEVLHDFLDSHGYKRLETSTDWLTIVKEKYRTAVSQSPNTVMDVRCPKIKDMLDEMGIQKYTVPDINPILIHCGQEVSEREDLLEEEKIITTPCQALADMGNALALRNTRFVSWRRFLEQLGEEPAGILPKESPIPLGFFTELGLHTVSLSGEEEIRKYFANGIPGEVQLIEMLFCKDGCHNGDGIRVCKS